MRKLTEYFLMADRDDFTKEEAAKVIEADIHEIAAEYKIPLSEARTRLLTDIGYYAGYYEAHTADRVFELFNTEHPIFGREHPTPAVAFRRGYEMGSQPKKEKI